jgi:hypothetical protein
MQARKETEYAKALLWEVATLRALALRVDQLHASLDNLGGGPGLILNALQSELKDVAIRVLKIVFYKPSFTRTEVHQIDQS